MNKRINFEDNIFILLMNVRLIRDIITLDADPELFLEKTLNDICFIDDSLRILLGNLEQNHHLIEREELLEQIANAEVQFSQALKELLEHEGNFSILGIPSLVEKVAAFRASSIERQKTAGKLQPSGESSGERIYVGSEELTELLKSL